jgi:hypothetical protein
MMSTSHDTNERRQAIWPWILMPLVVLVLFYTLQRFQDSAKSAAAQAQAHATGDAGDPSDTAEQ